MPSQSHKITNRLIYRIDNESQIICSKTTAQILKGDRRPAAEYQKEILSNNYQVLHNQLHQLILFTQEIINHPIIDEPEFKNQLDSISEIIKTSQVIREELDHIDKTNNDDFSDKITDPNEINSFINVIHNELVRIDKDIRLFEQMEEYTTRVLSLWNSIDKESPNCTIRLKQLTQRIIHDSSSQETFHLSSNHNFKTFKNLRKNEPTLLKMKALIESIHSAKISAWISIQLGWGQSSTETLVLASLLKDIGKIRQIKVFEEKPTEFHSKINEYHHDHPSLGAAISSGFKVLPVKLSELITQHHERHDGSGFPNQISGKEFSKESSLFITVSRLTECYADIYFKNLPQMNTGTHTWQKALTKIIKESEEGFFDYELTISIAKHLGFDWANSPSNLLELFNHHPTSKQSHQMKPTQLKKRIKRNTRNQT